MKNTSPIKNENLANLCRHHYNGLLIVCKIRRALRYGIATTWITTYIQEEFKTHLLPHINEEEEWLIPKLPEENPLRVHVEKQHAELRKMVNSFSDVTDIQSSLPEAFADLLEDHIRFEERTLLPCIKSIINEEALKIK